MDSLPEAVVQFIISQITNAKDISSCNCVSKTFKHSTPFIPSLYFPRNLFDNIEAPVTDAIITRTISSIVSLQQLIVYCPFSAAALNSWLSMTSLSLRHLELRLDTLNDKFISSVYSKLDCIGLASGLESLKLWGVLMAQTPDWGRFQGLKVLEIVGAKMTDLGLMGAIASCPNLVSLSLIGCDGLGSVSIELGQLEQCRLDFYGVGNCSLFMNTPKIRQLEVQGCSWIQARQTKCLTHLSISNNAGRMYKVDFGRLERLEFLSIRGVQWCWEAVTSILQCATEVKHLIMKIEFTGDYEALQPFPEVHFVDFFNKHPKLMRFEIHGAMFAALCHMNSLATLDSSFVIPCLEEVVVTVRSPLNAEQKMSTLESFLKYGKKLQKMVIRISQMKNTTHNVADEFFADIYRFSNKSNNIVYIQ